MKKGNWLSADSSKSLLDSPVGRISSEWAEISAELVSCVRDVSPSGRPVRRRLKPKIDDWSAELHPFFTNTKTRALFEKTVRDLRLSLQIRNIVCHDVLRCRSASAGYIEVYRLLTSDELSLPEQELTDRYSPVPYAHLLGQDITAIPSGLQGQSIFFCTLDGLNQHAYIRLRTLRQRVERFSCLARSLHNTLHDDPTSERAIAIRQSLERKNATRAGSTGTELQNTKKEQPSHPTPLFNTKQMGTGGEGGPGARHAKTLNRRRKKRK